MKLASTAISAVALLTAFGMPAAGQDDLSMTYIIWTESSNAAWAPVLRGVEEAAAHAGVNVDVQYGDSDPALQADIMETAVVNDVDCVAASLFVEDAFASPIEALTENGILFLAYNINDPLANANAMHPTFIGQDLEEAGYIIGKRALEQGLIEPGHNVFFPVEYPESTYAQLRFDGVMRAWAEAGITADDITYERLGTTASFEEALPRMVQYLIGHPETDLIVSLGGTPVGVAAQAAEEAGLDVIPNLGFDVNYRIIQSIDAGTTDSIVDQGHYMQGFMPVLSCALWKKYGIVPSSMNTGLAVVDQTNLSYLVEWEGQYR